MGHTRHLSTPSSKDLHPVFLPNSVFKNLQLFNFRGMLLQLSKLKFAICKKCMKDVFQELQKLLQTDLG